jgi:hypothetical protein
VDEKLREIWRQVDVARERRERLMETLEGCDAFFEVFKDDMAEPEECAMVKIKQALGALLNIQRAVHESSAALDNANTKGS